MANKTVVSKASVDDFLRRLSDEQQRRDSRELVKIMQAVSGEPPKMWGENIVGFGSYRYRYASGREGDWMKIGFAPRKGKLSLYITGDASQYEAQLEKIGPHAIGKGCIYLKNLQDIDKTALTSLIADAYAKDETY